MRNWMNGEGTVGRGWQSLMTECQGVQLVMGGDRTPEITSDFSSGLPLTPGETEPGS